MIHRAHPTDTNNDHDTSKEVLKMLFTAGWHSYFAGWQQPSRITRRSQKHDYAFAEGYKAAQGRIRGVGKSLNQAILEFI